MSTHSEVKVLELVSPIGHPRVATYAPRRTLETPVGRRVGFIWNQYQATRQFWPQLERAMEDACKPASVERAYKSNTWTPLEQDRFAALARSVDYLIVGVGA
ncbi:MAG: hypothetical protein IT531_00335 [Burkholderiales bacterium]|nr:hypothetical protein [Burkholderiales bacterium]